jgi:hypothetical protein
MVLLVSFALAAYLAYRSMAYGLAPVLSRLLMACIAIATGVGFAGPLCTLTELDNPYLFGGCLLAITLVTYGFLRGLTLYLMLEREVVLPEMADRIGGAIAGFFAGLLLTGFVSLSILAFPLPEAASKYEDQLRRSAEFGLAGARLIGLAAGNDQRLTAWNIIPHLEAPRGPRAPSTQPTD